MYLSKWVSVCCVLVQKLKIVLLLKENTLYFHVHVVKVKKKKKCGGLKPHWTSAESNLKALSVASEPKASSNKHFILQFLCWFF